MSSPNLTPVQTVAAFEKSRFSELRVVIVRPLNSGAYLGTQRWDRKEPGGELHLRHGNNAGIPPHLWPQVRHALDLACEIISQEQVGGAA